MPKNNFPDITWQYVQQDHQDRDKPYATLITMNQLNVDANRKAAQFQAEHGVVYRGQVPLSPRYRVHLLSSKGTITCAYTKKIQCMAAESPLRLYLLKKYEWSPAIYSSINWEQARGSALKKIAQRKIHYYTKLAGPRNLANQPHTSPKNMT